MSNHLMIECPSCGKPLRVREEYRGRRVGCKACGHQFVASPSPSADSVESDGDESSDENRLEALWDRDVNRPEPTVVSPNPRVGGPRRPLPIDEEPSSMLIPVRKADQSDPEPEPDIYETIVGDVPSPLRAAPEKLPEVERLRMENIRLRAELDALRESRGKPSDRRGE